MPLKFALFEHIQIVVSLKQLGNGFTIRLFDAKLGMSGGKVVLFRFRWMFAQYRKTALEGFDTDL